MTSQAYVAPSGHVRGHVLTWETEDELLDRMRALIGAEIDSTPPLITPFGPIKVWSGHSESINQFAQSIIEYATGELVMVTGAAILTGVGDVGETIGLTAEHISALELTSHAWEVAPRYERIRAELLDAVERHDVERTHALVDELAEIMPGRATMLRLALLLRGWQ